MSDLIDRQAAIDAIRKSASEFSGFMEMEMYTDDDAVEAINGVPSAEPVRRGKWIDEGQYDDFFPHHAWRCSECGEHVIEVDTPWYRYCPNCGARMDADETD